MDERLEAGRHHLQNGERATITGYPDEARSFFEAALVQFRGPDLRLGEGHALRGLAQVEMLSGDLTSAEERAREAIAAYQAVTNDLDRLDAAGLSHELRRDAREGEGASLTVLGEILLRLGQNDEARSTLSYAREIATDLGELPSGAAAWAASSRLALHEGRYADAAELLERTLALQGRAGNVAGQVEAWLMIADLRRLRRELKSAEDALATARPLAARAGSANLEGRVLSSLGALQTQESRLVEARQTYAEALPFARKGGDNELIGTVLVGLGDATSRTHEGFGLDHLLEGTRTLAGREQRQGVATGMLRIGEHALRVKAPELALLAGECARRLYAGTDPIRGVGYALRVIVKALAASERWEAVLVAATAREAIAGSLQQNARDVAEYYRSRVPPEWVSALKPLGARNMVERAEAMIAVTLQPILATAGLSLDQLDDLAGMVQAVDGIAARLPKPAPPEAWDREPVSARKPTAPPDDDAVILPGPPPVGEAPPVAGAAEAAPAAEAPPVSGTVEATVAIGSDTQPAGRIEPGHLAEAELATPADLPDAAVEPITEDAPLPERPAIPSPYDSDYDPPEPSEPPPASDAPEQDAPGGDEPVPDALKNAPPPSDYADYYDTPEDEKKA